MVHRNGQSETRAPLALQGTFARTNLVYAMRQVSHHTTVATGRICLESPGPSVWPALAFHTMNKKRG